MKNFLDNWRRQRDANRLAGGMEGAQEYMRRKAMVDNAPVGAVGAPSGIAEHQNALGGDALTNLGALGSFAPVIGDAVGLATDARYLYMNPEERTPLNYGLTAMGALPFVPAMSAMTAFHGSPHKFDVFDMKKVGTGEGAQAYGHGLYFAENPKVAENYADQVPLSEVKRNFLDTLPEDAEFEELLDLIGTKTFSEQQEQVIQALAADDWLGFDYPSQAISAAYSKNLKNWDPSPALIEAVSGSKNLYEVDIPDAAIDKMLDWNKPLREQPESVQKAMGDLWPDPAMTGGEAYTRLARMPGFVGDARRTQGIDGAYSSQNIVSQRLNDELGIPGIKYFDSGSRAASEGTRNFVVFDDKLPTVLKRNDEPINALGMGNDLPEERLLTTHNLSDANLLNANQIGGLPMPSIAVVDAEKPLTGFGEITLVGDSTLATPGRMNPVYSSDAYTARHPGVINELSKAGEKQIEDRLADSMKATGMRYSYGANQFSDSGARAFRDDPAALHAFITKKGITPIGSDGPYESYDMSKQIREAGLDEEFDQWVNDLIPEDEITRKLFAGYTPSGNRRYKPYTAENAVKLMKADEGESVSMYGAGAMRGKLSPKFKNLKEVKKARGRLVSADEMQAIKDANEAKLDTLLDDLNEFRKYKSSEHWDRPAQMEELTDVLAGKDSWSELYPNLPDELKQRAYEYKESISDMPTEYFEAKPRRVVDVGEFQGAIVPQNASQDVINALSGAGISRIEQYADEADRIAKFKQFQDLMYQVAPFGVGLGVASQLYRPSSQDEI